MELTARNRTIRYLLFLVLAFTINIVDRILTASVPKTGPRTLVAIAASFDLVVIVSGAYYWLLIRPGVRARWSLAAIALAGIFHATYLYPDAGAERAILIPICELSLIALAVMRIRTLVRRRDGPIERADKIEIIRHAFATLVPVPLLANLFTAEFAVLYYALFSWRAKPHVPVGAKAFSIHRRTSQPDLFFLLAIATLLEILPLHLLLSRWSPLSAWIATGLSLYGAIWLIGLARSIELLPSLIGPDYLHLRYGLLFRLRISREALRDVHRFGHDDVPATLAVPRGSKPELCVELMEPMYAEGPLGVRKRVSRIAFTPDDLLSFHQAMDELMRRK